MSSCLNRNKMMWVRRNALTITICFIFGSFFANMFLPYWKWNNLATCGTFGDQFGAVNALFSGLAFAGLIYTIMLQRSDLRNQRKELFLQRQEMKRNRDEMITQNKTLALQRFENTFFNMMELQQQIVNNLEYSVTIPKFNISRFKGIVSPKSESVTYRGREVFEHLYSGWNKQGSLNFETIIKDKGLSGYVDSDVRTMLDHYFRHFYTILNFIDKSSAFDDDNPDVAHNNKYQYAKILRATLSRYELVLLYYNGLSDVGNEKLKPLLERYSMLKNINENFLALSKDVVILLNETSESEIVSYLNLKELLPNDYYFYLTTELGDKKKYHLSAFYHGEEEMDKGREILSAFEAAIAEYKKK